MNFEEKAKEVFRHMEAQVTPRLSLLVLEAALEDAYKDCSYCEDIVGRIEHLDITREQTD